MHCHCLGSTRAGHRQAQVVVVSFHFPAVETLTKSRIFVLKVLKPDQAVTDSCRSRPENLPPLSQEWDGSITPREGHRGWVGGWSSWAPSCCSVISSSSGCKFCSFAPSSLRDLCPKIPLNPGRVWDLVLGSKAGRIRQQQLPDWEPRAGADQRQN